MSDHDSRDARLEDRLCAGRGAAVMVAGFERGVECGPASIGTVFERLRFGVRLSGARVETLTYDSAVARDHDADERVGCSGVAPALGKLTGAVHEVPCQEFLSPIRTITVGAGLRTAGAIVHRLHLRCTAEGRGLSGRLRRLAGLTAGAGIPPAPESFAK